MRLDISKGYLSICALLLQISDRMRPPTNYKAGPSVEKNQTELEQCELKE